MSCRKIYLPLVIRCPCLFISTEINFIYTFGYSFSRWWIVIGFCLCIRFWPRSLCHHHPFIVVFLSFVLSVSHDNKMKIRLDRSLNFFSSINKTHCHLFLQWTRSFANVNRCSLCCFVSGVFCFIVIRWINLHFQKLDEHFLVFSVISALRAISRVVKMEFSCSDNVGSLLQLFIFP